MMMAEILPWAGIALAILLLLTVWVISRRGWRTERARRERQLDSVYNSRMRRERGD